MKKLSVFLISLCMVVTMVPAAVFADTAGQDQQDPVTVENQGDYELPEQVEIQAPEEAVPAEQAEDQVIQDDQMYSQEGEEPALVPSGWTQDAKGHWLYYDATGTPLVGFQKFGNNTYYFNANGYMKTGWLKQNGNRYFFDQTPGTPGARGSKYGIMFTGWKKMNGTKYYFNPSTGKMHVGWLSLNNDRYFFHTNGKIATGWLKRNGSKYYLQSNGKMKTGWGRIKGAKYYFTPSNGKMKTGWIKVDGNKYYADTKTGKIKTGWFSQNGKKYYFTPSNGKMKTGLNKINGYRYYFSTSSGAMQTGVIRINGSLYYFQSNGRAYNSACWFGSGNSRRYSIGGGKIATGTRKIGSKYYVFSTQTGVLIRTIGDSTDYRMQSKSSNTKYLVYVSRSSHKIRVYYGGRDNWSRIHTYSCTVGKASSPTPAGTFIVRTKGDSHKFTENGVALRYWYWIHFSETGIGINSVPYYDDDTPAQVYDGRIGQNLSGGSVRVTLNNARYFHDNIPIGTKVIIE